MKKAKMRAAKDRKTTLISPLVNKIFWPKTIHMTFMNIKIQISKVSVPFVCPDVHNVVCLLLFNFFNTNLYLQAILNGGSSKPDVNNYFNDMLPSMVGMNFDNFNTTQRAKRRVKREHNFKEEDSGDEIDYNAALMAIPDGKIKKKRRKGRPPRDPNLPPKPQKNPRKKVKSEYDMTKTNCEDCNKTFKSNMIYRQHMKRVHARINVQCELCNKECPDASKLMEHKMRIHTEHVERDMGPLPRFRCDICPEGTSPAYVVARDLAKHMHVKHSGKGKFCAGFYSLFYIWVHYKVNFV